MIVIPPHCPSLLACRPNFHHCLLSQGKKREKKNKVMCVISYTHTETRRQEFGFVRRREKRINKVSLTDGQWKIYQVVGFRWRE